MMQCGDRPMVGDMPSCLSAYKVEEISLMQCYIRAFLEDVVFERHLTPLHRRLQTPFLTNELL